MPELPEVETIVNELKQLLIGATIKQATVLWERSIATPDVITFQKTVAGQTIQKIMRRGKYIVLSLTSDTILVHLRMTGKFSIASEPDNSPHVRIVLELDDGRFLVFFDQRKFGKWYLLSDPTEKLDTLGLEPLSESFTLAAFKQLLKGKKTMVKPFLLDQRFVSGLGNIYVDEALWAAKIHPQRPVSDLSDKETKALHQAIKQVLTLGVKHQGTSLGPNKGNYFSVAGRRGTNQTNLAVFRRTDWPCPRCQTPIQKIVVGQRGTHFCPNCQR